jgi:hypothetical protein
MAIEILSTKIAEFKQQAQQHMVIDETQLVSDLDYGSRR